MTQKLSHPRLFDFDGEAVTLSLFQAKRLGLIHMIWQVGPDHEMVKSFAKLGNIDIRECEEFLRQMRETADTEEDFSIQMDMIKCIVMEVGTKQMMRTSSDVVA